MSVHVAPPSIVFCRLPSENPPRPTKTFRAEGASKTIRAMYRFGNGFTVLLLSTAAHVGEALVPLFVFHTSPLFCPTQITSEVPGATAIALMLSLPGARIAVQVGVAARTLAHRHRLAPPASITAGLLGSRMK